jgi:arabinogalactan oligomer/maltooligosaccharide transport system permease protein
MINSKLMPEQVQIDAETALAEAIQTNVQKTHSMKRKKIISNSLTYLLLVVLCLVWITPIAAVFMVSIRNETGTATTLIPLTGYTWDNYINLLTSDTYPFLLWFRNTLLVAVFVMLISTIFVFSVAYTMSRLRFKGRRGLMNINLVLGMFPGFMSMIAVYNILKAMGISGSLIALILIYSAGSGGGFYIAKGFFDTISKSLDEAARIDGANNFKVFYKIILPLSKPIIVYTLLTSFMGPWVDYIYCSIILRTETDNYTVALGLYNMINSLDTYQLNYTMFFAGSVLISVPIMILFLLTQKYYVAGVTGGSVKG